jgi:membrane protein YdbS with pleckstrin-like domain
MTNLLWLITLSLLFAVAYFMPQGNYLIYGLGTLVCVLLANIAWSYVVLYNITYIIEQEQIIVKRGVFIKTTNYLEMYRIYDFEKRQHIVEAAFGLMSITLLSRDMSNSNVKFIGIANSDDVIPVIRERVEREKQRKRVIEFNNPYGTMI